MAAYCSGACAEAMGAEDNSNRFKKINGFNSCKFYDCTNVIDNWSSCITSEVSFFLISHVNIRVHMVYINTINI